MEIAAGMGALGQVFRFRRSGRPPSTCRRRLAKIPPKRSLGGVPSGVDSDALGWANAFKLVAQNA